MTYQVLARKWRPREFSSLIGQQAVVTALTNALREGRIAQAYLFAGIRGVGKTTAARLFAKALNCERGPERGPCNECATCREITAGADLDVLEIDAATYSKVEQVRDLAESLRYGPARDPYKVVVLDEVHRLSRQAFDALLKIVEEPPPRLVFIFATTEIDSVPATILSRCQEFHFRRVGASELTAHLAEICRAEGIEASEHALRLLARAGEGSVRDAVALLDQLATFGNGRVLEEEAARLVGGLDLALFARLLAAILAGDSATVVALAREVEAQGWDPRQVHAHFLAYCRDALHLALGAAPESTELPAEEAAELAARARAAGYEDLLRLLHHLLASETSVRRSDAAVLALELAWLRAAELPKLLRIEELLAGGGGAGAASAAPRARESAAGPIAALPPAATAPSPRRPQPAAGEPLARLREELSARRPTLAASLESAACEWRDGELRIAFDEEHPVAGSQFARASNRELLDAAVVAAFGAGARWRIVETARAAPSARGSNGPSEPPAAPPPVDDRVQAMLDIFEGSVVSPPADDRGAGGEADESNDAQQPIMEPE
jgi:DNA polymerase III subunit gamma/tau